MSKRFNFTTHDWIWFCVVFALALGWGSHFRYSFWLHENMPPRVVYATNEELASLQEELSHERQEIASSWSQEINARQRLYELEKAIHSVLSDDERQHVEKTTIEYRELQKKISQEMKKYEAEMREHR